jgi:CheY-like chemotaxis protein
MLRRVHAPPEAPLHPEASSSVSDHAALGSPDVEQVSSRGDATAAGLAREVDELLAAIAASLETARGQAEPGTPIRERLDRAAETLSQGSERMRQLVALTRPAPGPLEAAGAATSVAEAASRVDADEPSAAVAASAQGAGTPAASVRPAAGRVVILDDEEPLVRVGKHLLKRLGHEATGFIHPREALEALERDPRGFDVFITDLTMPEMSGYDVARAIAQIRSDLPIILLSGQVLDEGTALGLPNPVLRLGKPYTREQLQQVVEAALRRG